MQFSADETIDGLSFLAEAVIYSCVEPQVSITGDGQDVLALSELDAEDFRFLTAWVQAGSPGVPVKTAAGEVQPEKLQRFRQKRAGGRPADGSTDGDQVWDTAEPVARPG